ncbi:MAG: phosphotransferase [Planctomycetota bacterium]
MGWEAGSSADLDEALGAFARSEGPFKRRLERMLLAVEPAVADAVMLLLKESRGAWALLLGRSNGSALVCCNALSGTPVALATLGFRVTIVDRCPRRLRFALDRAKALVPGTTACVMAGRGDRLPFADGAFDVAVHEDGLPGASTGWGFDLEELRRTAREELLVTADNRLGYKRSTGRRGRFRRDPRVLVREVLRPSRGEASLPVTRARVRADWESDAAYSLYPHAREFSHVVALDAARPRLTIGPRERRNRIKMVGFRLGLFRWLTPSFAVHAKRQEGGASRLDRMLRRLSEEVGEPQPEADVLVATRSNDALVHTAPRAGERGDGRGRGDAGRWTVHVALQPSKRRMVAIHHGWLERIRRERPDVPVPEPLFHGDIEGADVAVERRLGGLGGTDVTGDAARTEVMFADAARILGQLVDDEPTRMDGALVETMLRARFRRVAELVGSERTRREVLRRADRTVEAFEGREVRLAVYHADLRGKHVQVDADGRVLGLLDWGASEERFLPLADLLQLVVHQRKQETGETFGEAWRAVAGPGTRRASERAAIDAYAERAGLDEETVADLFDAYPLLVAGMAERNWDYSRPDWVARQFGL